MKYVSWNMGCAPSMAKYRKTHAHAWQYLLAELRPDVALVQEALLTAAPSAPGGQLYWSEDRGSESGAGIFVRDGLQARSVPLQSKGSYVAAVELTLGGSPTLVASVHVGPPDYKKHLRTLLDDLSQAADGRRFVIGGDLNAARHWDDVYGGRWYTKYFEDLGQRHFHDCHWAQHGKEVQSFWGHQAREAYQCDHLFVDEATAPNVSECAIVDNADVRRLSDHGPIHLTIRDIDEGPTSIRPS
jgi:endonuclease/exonuclease/phosphatase family metal-dependent hydrolase